MTSYVYDADGWRIKKVTPSAVTYYLRGPQGELLTEWTNPGPSGVIRDFVYAGSRLVSSVKRSSALDSGDVIETAVANGVDVPVTIATAGQAARLLFNGTAGQSITATMTIQTPFSCNWTLAMLAPDGTSLAFTTPCSGTTALLGPVTLPINGTYTVVADPVGATTGSVLVALGNSTTGAPAITNVTPTIGGPGTVVTVSGTNLSPLTSVRFNGTSASVLSGSATTFQTAVPPLSASGRVTVTTAAGGAASTTDFFVPPAPYGPADVETTGRLPFGTPTVVTITQPTKIGLRVFDRIAGQRFSVNLTNRTFALQSVKILRPDGSVLVDLNPVYPSGLAFVNVKTAPMSGTYTVVIDPSGTYTGSDTLTLYDVPPDVTGTIAPNGPPVPFAITTPGHNGRLTFIGTAGQRVALAATSTTIAYTTLTIQAPDGSTVATGPVINNQALNPTTLPLTGTYSVLINPFDLNIGNMTLTLYDVPPDVDQPIQASTPLPVTTTPFQNGYLRFSRTAGQRISVQASAGTYGSTNLLGAIFQPGGSTLASWTYMGTTAFIDVKTVTASATHTIQLDPQWTAAGGVTITLHDVPPDPTTTLTVGGGTAALTTTAPGQNATATFTGRQGQQVTVRLTGNAIGQVTVTLLKPDGGVVTASSSSSSNFNLSTQTLPTSGTYTVKINPNAMNVGAITVQVTSP